MLWPLALIRRLFAPLSVCWAVLLPVAALASARPDPPAWLWSFSLAMYGLGTMLCHQVPERSFHLWSRQLPVCARCTGLYAGAAIGAVVAAYRWGTGAGGANRARLVLLVAALPTIATFVLEWATFITPTNWVRALAGLPLGAAVGWLVIRVN